jgi:ribosome recycling factor
LCAWCLHRLFERSAIEGYANIVVEIIKNNSPPTTLSIIPFIGTLSFGFKVQHCRIWEDAMQLDMKKSEDSYSMAAKERMAIELDALVLRLNEVGSALAVLNLFRRADIEVEGKKRRLRDFVEVDLGPDPMAGTFKVIVHTPIAISGAVAVLKENKFINIDTSSQRELKVVKPRLTIQQEDDLESEIKRVTKSSLSKLASIKSDALQRVQAAIKAEYIEPKESKTATLQLDDLIIQASQHAGVLGLIRRKQLIGGGLTFDGPDEEALYKRINDRAYKDVWQELLVPKVTEDDE